MKRTGRAVFTSVGMVPAPECDSCGQKMKPASATDWKCGNQACPRFNEHVHTGVYPVTSTGSNPKPAP